MEKIRLLVIAGVLAAMLAACSKKSQPTPVTPPPPPPDTLTTVLPPSKTALSAPANNQPCIVGATVSATQSKVTFTWLAAAFTDSYELHIKNLVTNDSTVFSTANLTMDVTLALARPYSWYIISKSKQTTQTAQSDTWKFYNSGPATSFYPPYPAQLTYPANNSFVSLGGTAQTGTVTLKWNATAGSSPIKTYTVLVNLDGGAFSSYSNLTTNQLDITVYQNGVYDWKVVTTDAAGNSSTSMLSGFYVE